MEVVGQEVRTSISVGIAHHGGSGTSTNERRATVSRRRGHFPNGEAAAAAAHRETTAQHLLRSADSAMYVAKSAGKGQAVLADLADLLDDESTPAPVAG
jgi:GGDEF domain-containing protein